MSSPKFFRPLAEALLHANCDVTLICGSPRLYKDAAMMKRVVAALVAAKK